MDRSTGPCPTRLHWSASHELRHTLSTATAPIVLEGAFDDWAIRAWTPEKLTQACGELEVVLRIGKRQEGCIPRESECIPHRCRLAELCDWMSRQGGCIHAATGANCHSLCALNRDAFFAYLDYKYFHEIFAEHPEMRDEAVNWAALGPVSGGVAPAESVLWVGSPGAATGLHKDCYGGNLVAQVFGEKEWTLFPPEATSALRPTRIPYEESSVYSQMSARQVQAMGGLRVRLQPGELLHVPHHWWHQVACVTPSVSVNVWVPHKDDGIERVGEGLVKVVLSALMGAGSEGGSPESDEQQGWLNPNEEAEPLPACLDLLSAAVGQLLRDEGGASEHEGSSGDGRAEGVTSKDVFLALTHPEVIKCAREALMEQIRGRVASGD